MKLTKKKQKTNSETSKEFQELMNEGKPYKKVNAEYIKDRKVVRTTFEGERVIEIEYKDELTAFTIYKIEKMEVDAGFKYLIVDKPFHESKNDLDLVDLLYFKYLEMHTMAKGLNNILGQKIHDLRENQK